MLLPLAALVAAFLFLRGHNLPGGGFIAGLVLACAILVLRIGGGGRPILDPAHLPYQPWIAAGLLVAALTGVGSMLAGYPFLTSAFVHPVLPVVGEVPHRQRRVVRPGRLHDRRRRDDAGDDIAGHWWPRTSTRSPAP